jgi:outer membrane protein OmpA-like peptidoglycan-associated protein
MLAIPGLAAAQPVSGINIDGAAGLNWMQSTNDTNDPRSVAGLGLDTSDKLQTDLGLAAVLSVGYGFGNGLRVELEGNDRYNELDSVQAFGSRLSNGTGEVLSYGAMANVFYDFDPSFLGLGRPFVQPYIGAGVGYVWVDYQDVGGILPGTGDRFTTDDSDARFAFQGIVGLAFPFTWVGVPGLSITTEYRFFGTLQPKLNSFVQGPSTGGARVAVGNLEPDSYNHSFMLGIRDAFQQPAPPPPPMPLAAAPAVARTYLVFFDFDRADLTDRARQIVAEAAQNSTRVQTTRIEVAGHADRAGSPAYNQRLSQRRADVVAAELLRNGIQREQIIVTAFGESRPLVATADGVREPQNRRVEIVLR